MRFGVVLLVLCVASAAHAQAVDRRYADEPTGGLALPATPMAGEHDARAVAINPGGLALLRGPELALALDVEDVGLATSAGQGFGTYLATSGGGRVLPRVGMGLGLEWLRPPRSQLEPDPGAPFRFTLAYALGLGSAAGLGLAWHHFLAEGALDGVDTFDLGLSARVGAHVALGAAVRDLATAPVAQTPVQRRYELEAVVRPLATDRLELAAGGRLGETRTDVDGWGRLGVRAARGVYVVGQLESRELHTLEDSPMGRRDLGGREVRATLGVELSFGQAGLAAYGTGLRDDAGGRHVLAGTFVARVSAAGPPSVLGEPDHLERVELSGEIGARALTVLVRRLREIARDDAAKGVVVVFDGVSGGWATLQELRTELRAVRRAGKKVFAYLVTGTGRDYYVASVADKIYVDPAGGLRIVGMAGTTLFFRGLFDAVGVLPQFVKIGEYKSAPEQLTETGPTAPAAAMHEAILDSLWQEWVAAVADGRHLTPAEVQALVDAGPYTAGDLAREPRLVDAVASPDRVSELVVAEMGHAYPLATPSPDRPAAWQRPTVAVIYVDGDIIDGASKTVPVIDRRMVGGQTVVDAITAARADPRVGAIVLRINSPGGSAIASELISREVFATRGVKPILCSMSDYAASGGYFVAAGCDTIFAEPMTVTGSIGIFSGKFDVGGLLAKLGITTSTSSRGKNANLESWYAPYTAAQRALLQDKLRYMYGRFVGAVADGRKMTKEAVDAVGRGHVYTGAQARPRGLVDRFGGLGDALDEARRRMGLAPGAAIALRELPRPPASLFGLVGKLIGAHATTLDTAALPVVRELLRAVPASVLAAPEVPQARLPYELVIP